MSKESYARGFVKAAADAGVDPTELAKLAANAANRNAGIGSVEDNFGEYMTKWKGNAGQDVRVSDPHKGSYMESLRRASDGFGPIATRNNFVRDLDARKTGQPITQGDLERVRHDRASEMAGKIFPKGTNPYSLLVENLIRAVRQNQKSYIETGSVQPRKVVDKTGIDKLQIPDYIKGENPEKRERLKSKLNVENMDDWLKVLQNSMVRKGPAKTQGNIA